MQCGFSPVIGAVFLFSPWLRTVFPMLKWYLTVAQKGHTGSNVYSELSSPSVCYGLCIHPRLYTVLCIFNFHFIFLGNYHIPENLEMLRRGILVSLPLVEHWMNVSILKQLSCLSVHTQRPLKKLLVPYKHISPKTPIMMYNDIKFINSAPVNKNLPRDLVILSQTQDVFESLFGIHLLHIRDRFTTLRRWRNGHTHSANSVPVILTAQQTPGVLGMSQSPFQMRKLGLWFGETQRRARNLSQGRGGQAGVSNPAVASPACLLPFLCADTLFPTTWEKKYKTLNS